MNELNGNPIRIAVSPKWGQLAVCMIREGAASHWHRYGNGLSLAELADAGRRHLAEHHWAPIQDQINHVVGRMNTAMNSVGPFAACDRPDCPICCARRATEPCGLGMCAANAGHEGTCAEASGWADE